MSDEELDDDYKDSGFHDTEFDDPDELEDVDEDEDYSDDEDE
jgi:hypothetical protein